MMTTSEVAALARISESEAYVWGSEHDVPAHFGILMWGEEDVDDILIDVEEARRLARRRWRDDHDE